MNNTFVSNSEKETFEIGKQIAKKLKKGDIVTLEGELGAGKTELIKGICEYFNVDELVTSPTFTIMNEYQGNIGNRDLNIFHIDLYRIKNTGELTEIGFEECLAEKNDIKLIEWPEKAGNRLEKPDLKIKLIPDNKNENKRTIIIEE